MKLRPRKSDQAPDDRRRVTELAPEDAVNWHWRGITANGAGRFDDAADSGSAGDGPHPARARPRQRRA